MLKKPLTINIVANAAMGPAISGGDKIFIECARFWARAEHKINIFTWEEGLEMCRKQKLSGVNFILSKALFFKNFYFPILYLARTIIGVIKILKFHFSKEPQIIYSASDFWPDSIPAFFAKLKNKNLRWIAGFYLFSPNPINFPRLKNFFYYFSQKPILWLILKFANLIFVTGPEDKEKFKKLGRKEEEIIIVYGGVETKAAQSYKGRPEPKIYDACFVGRFHPQKGVLELIEIWEKVCQIKPAVRLAMIGVGELEGELREKIKEKRLERNIVLLGYLDGDKKYKVFRQSRMILHPVIYDSGGMAPAEGMAWGLPAVGFNLPSLEKYYPSGMLKAPAQNIEKFTQLVLELLENRELYQKTSREARALVLNYWGWERRTDFLLEKIQKLL